MFYLVDSFERYKNSRYRQRYDRVNVHVFYLREFSLRQNWRASPPPPRIPSKRYEGVREQRLRKQTEYQLEQSQSTLRNVKNIQNRIFIITQFKKKGKQIYLALPDLERDFDQVSKHKTDKNLINRNINATLETTYNEKSVC